MTTLPQVLGVSVDKIVAEFVGTFVLVFTVGCNVLTPSAGCFGVTAVAFALVVMIYAFGSVSGANLNPAVTLALASRGVMGWLQVPVYWAAQFLGGILGAFLYVGLNNGASFNLEPGSGFGVDQAVAVECAYTCMLCFVVLCVATSQAQQPNSYYGLAIGFVIVAGGYGAGAISGGAFNPAVALAIDVSSAKDHGFHWAGWYIAGELAGAGIAVTLHRLVYPEEYSLAAGEAAQRSLFSKCAAEVIGSYFLVLTVLLNVKVKAVSAAWSIAASLMSMVYACGPVSGSHFNPAVTLAVLTSRRQKIGLKDALCYMPSQVLGGLLAAVTHAAIFSFGLGQGAQTAVAPRKTITLKDAMFCEMVFTGVLCLVVLVVATHEKRLKNMYGLAIGMCITVGGVASGKISGGALNPIVVLSMDFASLICGATWKAPENLPAYWCAEFAGAGIASAAFWLFYPGEFKGEGMSRWFADPQA